MGQSKQDWRAIIAACKSSGKPQAQWCKENGVNYNTLKHWLQIEKKNPGKVPAPTQQWLKVEIKEEPQGSKPLVLQIGLVHITVEPGFDPNLLADVIKTLSAAC